MRRWRRLPWIFEVIKVITRLRFYARRQGDQASSVEIWVTDNKCFTTLPGHPSMPQFFDGHLDVTL
jgi:hypothetical protein